MKNLRFLLLTILTALAFGASAQSTTPRFGTTPGQDNTGRVLNYRFYSPTDAAGADTVNLALRAYQTVISYTAVDSLAFDAKTITNCYVGDRLTFIVTNSSGSGHQVKFIGSNWALSSDGDIALTSGTKATIEFVFDGESWLESGRQVQ